MVVHRPPTHKPTQNGNPNYTTRIPHDTQNPIPSWDHTPSSSTAAHRSTFPHGINTRSPTAHSRIMSAGVGKGAFAGGGSGSPRSSRNAFCRASTSQAFKEHCRASQRSITAFFNVAGNRTCKYAGPCALWGLRGTEVLVACVSPNQRQQVFRDGHVKRFG
jgi:hypothetical protein